MGATGATGWEDAWDGLTVRILEAQGAAGERPEREVGDSMAGSMRGKGEGRVNISHPAKTPVRPNGRVATARLSSRCAAGKEDDFTTKTQRHKDFPTHAKKILPRIRRREC